MDINLYGCSNFLCTHFDAPKSNPSNLREVFQTLVVFVYLENLLKFWTGNF